MAKQSDKQRALLAKGQRLWNYARNSSQYTAWLKEARDGFGLYDGTAHWTADELEVLRQRRQAPSIVNKFAPKIDTLAGVEVQTRTEIAFRPRNSEQTSAQDVAAAYTYLASYHQEQLDLSEQHSQSFKDGCICGLGWTEADSDGENVQAGWVDPFEMLWDVDDTTPDLSDQGYTIRYRWTQVDKAIERFPKFEKELRALAISGGGPLSGFIQTQSNNGTYTEITGDQFNYFDRQNQRVCIIEVQYKELSTVYEVMTANNTLSCFLTEEEARKFRGKGAKIEKKKEAINKFLIYTQDVLLENGISVVQGRFFSYVPFVFKRGRIDRVPYGLARAARYPQIEYNKRRSKALHLLNSRQVIMDTNAVESISELREQIARPDGIIQKKKGFDLDIADNVPMEQSQVELMGVSDRELAEVMGVFDDLMGQQTNTVSGLAQQKRQESSVRTHAFAFSLLKRFKKRFGEALLAVMNATYKEETYVNILDNDKFVKLVKLNSTDNRGDAINSTAGLLFDIFVEQVPEHDSVPAEEAERLTQILMNGQGQFLVVPQFAKMLGFREPEKVSEAVKQILASSQPPADGANPQAGGATATQPSLPQ